MNSGSKVYLICYPYYPSKDTGRGHNKYIFELQEGIKTLSPDINLHLLHQGFYRSIVAAGIKQFKLTTALLSEKAGLYHAISPIGEAMAALLGKSHLVVTIHDLVPFHVKGYDNPWPTV